MAPGTINNYYGLKSFTELIFPDTELMRRVMLPRELQSSRWVLFRELVDPAYIKLK